MTEAVAPLHMAFDVRCSAAHAFDVWTSKTSMWWPPSHTVTQERKLRIIFEGRRGGRIFERTEAGVEVDWGEITVWEPPNRLGYLWRIATEQSNATEVEIQFRDQGDGTTRVEIEHRGWEHLGDFGPEWRGVNQGGWDGVLPVYVEACANPSLRD